MSESFFVSCALGCESALETELREVWPWLLALDGRFATNPCPELTVTKGGIEFEADLHLGLQLNFFLKLANRVLLRLADFKCRDFPKLYSKFEVGTRLRGALEKFVSLKNLQLEVAASESRLNNEKRISETIYKALGLEDLQSQSPQFLYVRVRQDHFTMSLDTSGEHLHRRSSLEGERWIGEAPLRETLAAFCLRSLIGDTSWSELNQVTLIDPMAGSGTFLSEASCLHQLQHRSFAFQKWKAVPKALSLPTFFHALTEKKKSERGGLWHQLIGSDIDKKAADLMKHNISKANPMARLQIRQENVFESLRAENLPAGRRWVILNAPYGERLKWAHTSEQLCKALVDKWSPERMGILWSEAQAKAAPLKIQGLSLTESHGFKNGGIPVLFQIWKK